MNVLHNFVLVDFGYVFGIDGGIRFRLGWGVVAVEFIYVFEVFLAFLFVFGEF